MKTTSKCFAVVATLAAVSSCKQIRYKLTQIPCMLKDRITLTQPPFSCRNIKKNSPVMNNAVRIDT